MCPKMFKFCSTLRFLMIFYRLFASKKVIIKGEEEKLLYSKNVLCKAYKKSKKLFSVHECELICKSRIFSLPLMSVIFF